MSRLLVTFALVAALSGCQHAGSQVWRASEENGDKPGVGFELRKESGKITGVAYLLDPNHPHDFSHGVARVMTLLEQTPKEAKFSVKWNEATQENLVFQFKEQDWPVSFRATVTQISSTEQFEPQTYSFEAAR